MGSLGLLGLLGGLGILGSLGLLFVVCKRGRPLPWLL